MELDEIKEKIAGTCHDLGSCFPYEGDQVEGEDWQSVADFTRRMAAIIGHSASIVAGYAGYAQRQANEGRE